MTGKHEAYLRVVIGADRPEIHGEEFKLLGQVDLPTALQTGNDVFAEWRWDGATVFAKNCRLGFFPIFYYATENEFGVSASVDRLLECGAPDDLDNVSMATFLRLGFLLGENTVFSSIKMLPPGGEVRWSGGEPSVTGGCFFQKTQRITRSDAIEGYGELFRQAIARRVSDDVRFGLPLSGGRDSRHILLELIAQGYRPDVCYTNHDFPPYRTENIKVAGMLTKRLGLVHQILGQPKSRLKSEIKKNKINNYQAMENTWCMSLYPAVAECTPVIYEGLGGDILSAGMYLKDEDVRLFEHGRIDELAEQLVQRWSWKTPEDVLQRILTVETYQRFSRELAVENVVQELEKHRSAASPMTSFYFWNRDRRVGALQPFAIAREAGVSAITPYIDYELVDFLLSLPSEMYLDKTFHTETIHRMHPEFEDIPYAGDMGTSLSEDNWHYRRMLLELGMYLAMKGQGDLVRKGVTIRRALAIAFSSGNVRMHASWIAPFQALYMAQLESL